MLRKTAQFFADLVGGNLSIVTVLTALCALLGLVHGHHLKYLVPVGLVLGTALVFGMMYAMAEVKLSCSLCVAFVLLAIAYNYSNVYPNLHASTAWIFLAGAAFLTTPAWIVFQFDTDTAPDRAVLSASTLTLLVVLAPLVWGTDSTVMALVLIWTIFATVWEHTQLLSAHKQAASLRVFIAGLLPLLAIVVTYDTVNNKWVAAIGTFVVYFLSAMYVEEKLNPKPQGYGALA